MDLGTLIGVISLSIDGIQICYKTFRRYEEYRNSLHSIPDSLEVCHSRLETLRGILERYQGEEPKDDGAASDEHLALTYNIISTRVTKLNAIVAKLQIGQNDSKTQLLLKAARSLRKEAKISKISNEIDSAVKDLTLGQVQQVRSLVAGHKCLGKSIEPTARLPLASTYGLPPRRLSRLIGRQDTLSELKSRLLRDPEQTCPISLWGLNGQGKTQTVLELVRDPEILNAYETVIWINAGSIAAIVKQYEDIAWEITIPGGIFSDAQSKIDFVLVTLDERKKPSLFVFDHNDSFVELHSLEAFLPKHRSCAIVYLKAHSDPTFQGTSLMIPALSIDDAVALLLESSGYEASISHVAHARNIARRLGCLPMALVQAGHWLRALGLPLQQFLSQFNLHYPFVFPTSGPEAIFARNVSTTWAMALEAFSTDKDLRSDLIQMLLFCSILYNDVMNARFALYLWQDLGEAPVWTKLFLTHGVWSEAKFIALIKKLGDFSLVSILDWRDGHCHFSIHPMIRQWIRAKEKDVRLLEITLSIMGLVADLIDRDVSQPMELKKQNHVRLYVVSCLQSLSELEEMEGIDAVMPQYSQQILEIKYRFVAFISNVAAASETSTAKQIFDDPFLNNTKLLEQCYEGYSRLLEPTDTLVLEIADKLGDAYTNDNQFEKAEGLLKKTLEAQDKPMSATLANCYRKQGKTDEASEAYEQLLSQSSAMSVSNVELLRSMMGCGLNDLELEDSKRAEKWFLEVIGIAKLDLQQGKLKGEAYMELSNIYWESSRRSEAADAELNAFQTFEIVYGAEDPRTLSTGHKLARIYFTMNEWFKCEALYCKVIAGYEAAYGSENQHTNSARHCHSHTLCYLGRDEEGEAGHTAAFYGLLAEPGIEDQFTQDIFNCLLDVYDVLSLEAKRTELYKQILPKVRLALPKNHPFRMRILRKLAGVHKESGLLSEAEGLLRELIATHEDFVSVGPLERSEGEARLGLTDSAQAGVVGKDEMKEHDAARNELAVAERTDKPQEESEVKSIGRRSNNAREDNDDNNDEDINEQEEEDTNDKYLHDLELLGEVLREQNNSSEAETVFRKLLELRTKALGIYDPDTLVTMLTLKDLYEDMNKEAEAEEIFVAYETAIQTQMMEQLRLARESRKKKSTPTA
ncbi:hypothetical protein MMC10_007724 [Thelotrema lepadinum]|nr:hypothetical protein [Thelotrema lepadinum]